MDRYPFVSVVMPVRDEGAFLATSLGAVLAQNYPAHRIEILVVDGMSTDGTRDMVSEFQTKVSSLTLLDNPSKIVPTGLNIALAKAIGDVIVRVDGHCEIDRDYVRCCVEHLRMGDVDAVGGPLETIGTTRIAQTIAVAMSSNFGVGGVAFRTIKNSMRLVDTVAFPAYTRAALLKAGLFDEELVRNQDDEYNYRLRKLGGKILLAPDIRSRYYSRGSLSSLWRQYFQYGYWKVRVMQKHTGLMQPRQFVPPVFVLVLLLSLLAFPFTTLGKVIFGLTSVLYALANLAATILITRKHGRRLFTYLPVVFLTLHMAYGTGFVKGLFRFWNRWRDRETNADYLVGPFSSERV